MTGIRRELLNLLLIAGGIVAAAFGLTGFFLSSNVIDGGVTGVSMLLAKVTTLPLVSTPFIVLGYRQLGSAFAIRSALAIAGLSAAPATIYFPDVTPDRLLTC